MKNRTAVVVSSVAGLATLVVLVFVAASLFTSGRDFWVSAIAGCLFTVPIAISAWNGTLSKGSPKGGAAPETWQEWLGVFVIAALTSAAFIAIDLAVVHPGFSLLFTLAALSFAFVALPSALRAWLIQALVHHRAGRDNDA